MSCRYCGIDGHGVDECPDRLEEYHGLPADNIDESQPDDAETIAGSEVCPGP